MKQLIISLICFLFFASNAYSDTDNNSHFHNITVRDGLSNDWVKAIVQDNQGFMWFATNDGLSKFDGNDFKNYRYEQRNSNSLFSNIVNSLFIDRVGNVWIASSKGLNYYDVVNDKIFRVDGTAYNITGIMQSDKDNFIISSYNGIFTYNTLSKKVEHYTIPNINNASTNYPIRKMVSYGKHALVFAIGGCYMFNIDNKTFKLLYHDNNIFNGAEVRAAYIHNNILWMGNLDNGLIYVDLETKDSPQRFESKIINQQSVFCITTNNKNQLIIGCENNGLVFLDIENNNEPMLAKNIRNEFNQPFGLINNSVHSIYVDKQNDLWIGTYNGISCQYNDGKGFSLLTSNANNANSLSNNMVSSILEVGNKLWIGTENGVDIFNTKRNKVKSIKSYGKSGNDLLSEAIIALETDDNGNVWAGSWSGGIDIINTKGKIIRQIIRGKGDQCLSHNSIMTIKKDHYGNMWVGSNGGGIDIYLKEEQKFIRYKKDLAEPNSLSNNYILSFLFTKNDEVWVATHDGLNLFNSNDKTFKCFKFEEANSNSIAGNIIDCLLEGNNGEIWVGTISGLSCFKRSDSTFTNYYVEDGLPNNYIKSLLCDENNRLWIGTNAGLSKLIISEEDHSVQFINYNVADGLIGDAFIRRACYKKRNGDFCFGTKNGLIYFKPNHIISNSFVPDVQFTSLWVNNKQVKVKDNSGILNENICLNPNIKLKYNQSNITLSFAALNFVVPTKNQYKYKLHNFDNDWVSLGNETKATYTNIPYGKYEFQIIASNNSNVWNETGAKLNIQITPPWYRTKLAYILYFVIIMLLILSYRFFIVKQTMLETKLELEIVEKENLNRIHQMKTKFFTNISHEFLTPLSLIMSPLEAIGTDSEFANTKLKNKISPIYRNAKRLQRLINQLLDISKINADHMALKVSIGNLHNFIYDIYLGFKNLANQKKINLEYQSGIENKLLYFDADKIEKIIYNLLSNAIKFTPEKGEIIIELFLKQEQLCIKIIDSGIGISTDEKAQVFESFYQSKRATDNNYLGTGVGLNLVNGLVNVYKGSIGLESKINHGSCFTIMLPYRKEDFKGNVIDEQNNNIEPLIDIDDAIQVELTTEAENVFDEALPNILLVEDNIELNGHIVDLLCSNYNITSAFNGEQGINLAKNTIPDLIIADWVMPKMSGIELLKSLRENESTSHIPLIILTAKIDNESKLISIDKGADAFIAKPFDKQNLESTIRNLLKSRENLKKVFRKSIVIEPTQVQITSVDEKFIEKAIKIIEDNFVNQYFTVDFMAKEIGMSRAQLHRKIKGLLGMSTSSFIRDIKIKKAADMLTIGQLRVSEAMYEVNIKSRNYFTKCFKEKYGMQPTEYIKQYKIQKEVNQN